LNAGVLDLFIFLAKIVPQIFQIHEKRKAVRRVYSRVLLIKLKDLIAN